MIGGVCSGLAEHFGNDPLLFRVGFVALGLLGLGGVVAYVAAWALIPADDGPPRSQTWHRASWLGWPLLVIGGLLAAPVLAGLLTGAGPVVLGPVGGFDVGPLPLAAVLVLVGLALLRQPEPSRPSRPPNESAERVATEVLTQARGTVAIKRRKRERSPLTAFTLAAALLVFGGAALLSSTGVVSVDVGQLAALALAVVGAGLLVGAWFGRGRLLIPMGILMIPPVLLTSLVNFPLAGSIGSPYLTPRGTDELESLRYLAGQVTLDLSRYRFVEGDEHLRLRVAAGSMTVIVPHDVRVVADVAVRGGEAFVFGGNQSGFGLHVERAVGPEDATSVLHLEIEAGFGSVGVYRMNPPAKPVEKERNDRKDNRSSRTKDEDSRPRDRGDQAKPRRDREKGRTKG